MLFLTVVSCLKLRKKPEVYAIFIFFFVCESLIFTLQQMQQEVS
jgi:hypothetical protein